MITFSVSSMSKSDVYYFHNAHDMLETKRPAGSFDQEAAGRK